MNTLFWFQNDCRLHDNEALLRAAEGSDRLLCVFCIDPRWFKKDQYGTQSLGLLRQQFLDETLSCLNKHLTAIGQTLHIVYGEPVSTISKLLNKQRIQRVVRSQHSGFYENMHWENLSSRFPKLRFDSFDTFTLFTPEQLISDDTFPASFSKFRKIVENIPIAEPLKRPTTLPPPLLIPVQVDAVNKLAIAKRKTNAFSGGEDSAITHCHAYFNSDAPSSYKLTRNELNGWPNSSKFSPWLAIGAISPRYIVKKLNVFEDTKGANDSTEWILFELLWREYFQWYAKHYDNRLFSFSGIHRKKPLTSFYPQRFKQWATGNTPWPLVNACMHELNATGFMSNRGRQIVASALVNELGLDWRCGAAYFEQQLIDYDVASNWANWQYIAGVGADPRGGRHFNIEKQTTTYDPHNKFIDKWRGKQQISTTDTVDAVDWPIKQ